MNRVLAACLILAAPSVAHAAPPAEVLGEWATKGFSSIVDIHPCADDGEALCGSLAWLWDPVDETGKPVLDRQNSNEALRDRPLAGLEFLKGFKRKPGTNVWQDGRIYNAEDGRTYSGSIRLKAPGVLELEGCALGLFCGSQVWRRPDEVLSRALRRP